MKASAKNTSAAKSKSAGSENVNTTVLEESGIGDVKIHENVISSLARRAALGVEGVSRLAGSLLMDNIAEIVGSRRMQDRAITVNVVDGNRISIEIKLNIKFGYRLPAVASEVQKGVISCVEAATGMSVIRVDVLVQEIDAPQEQSDDSGDAAPSIPAPPIN